MKVPHAKPGTSLKNKTGGAAKQPEIDKEKCIGCRQCVEHCPDATIHMEGKKAVVNLDYCKGCGICSWICPVKAVTMKERK